MTKGINLLSVEECESARDEMSSGIEDVVDKIACLEGILRPELKCKLFERITATCLKRVQETPVEGNVKEVILRED